MTYNYYCINFNREIIVIYKVKIIVDSLFFDSY